MKIKSMTKYSFSGALKAYLIFAAIIFAIINTVVIITAATGSQGGSFGGMDFSTVVFMFILGIVNYREDLQKNIFLLNCYSIRPYCSNWFCRRYAY